MGERKVLNRYVPPDFDPSILPKFKREKGKMIEVRMMLPFSMRCNTCGEYMYMGKKFNSRSEIVKGDDYMGIRKFRFYIKCCVCSAEITFKTDPKNSGYECESGASRNFEMWRETETATEEARIEREKEDEEDAMKALENRTLDSKIEMDVLDALDEIKSINQRHERIDTSKLISSLYREKDDGGAATAAVDSKHVVNKATGVTAADEELIRSIKFKSKAVTVGSAVSGADGVAVGEELTMGGVTASSAGQSTTNDFFSQINKQIKQQQTTVAAPSLASTVIVKKKRKIECAVDTPAPSTSNQNDTVTSPAASVVEPAAVALPSGLGGLLMGYGDSDNDSN